MARNVFTTSISLPKSMAKMRRWEGRTTSDLVREALRNQQAPKQVSLESQLLKSLCISLIGTDPEGEYRPEFITKMLAAAAETPTRAFHNPKALLAELAAV